MTLPGTAELIAAHRSSDHDFDSWIASRDAAAGRTFSCSKRRQSGVIGSCWCNSSVPSGDICNAKAAMQTLPSLHSEPKTIGRFMRQQSHSLLGGVVGGLVSPKPFTFPWLQEFLDDIAQLDFLEDLLKRDCPLLELIRPCLTLRTCGLVPPPPDPTIPNVPSSSTDPYPPPSPPPPPNPPRPYKCKRDAPGWGSCRQFSLANSREKGSALKYLLKQGCALPKSCTTTTFNNNLYPTTASLPLNGKFKVRTLPGLTLFALGFLPTSICLHVIIFN